MKSKLILAIGLIPMMLLGLFFSSGPTSAFNLLDLGDLSSMGNFGRSQSNLTLQGIGGETGTARAAITSRVNSDDLYSVSIRIQTSGLMMTSSSTQASQVFEGWLIDDNSGYKLSLGAFTTNRNGRGTLRFTQNMVNFTLYDRIAVSREAINDVNPNPATIVLQANLSPSGNIRQFSAQLRGSKEVPPNSSVATANGNFAIDTQNNILVFNIQVSGLEGTETGAHIHGFASSTQNAPILFNLPSGNNKIGFWHYDQSMESQILAGQTYANVHSTKYPDGEIRAQLVP